jgi:hypothetical protein
MIASQIEHLMPAAIWNLIASQIEDLMLKQFVPSGI